MLNCDRIVEILNNKLKTSQDPSVMVGYCKHQKIQNTNKRLYMIPLMSYLLLLRNQKNSKLYTKYDLQREKNVLQCFGQGLTQIAATEDEILDLESR